MYSRLIILLLSSSLFLPRCTTVSAFSIGGSSGGSSSSSRVRHRHQQQHRGQPWILPHRSILRQHKNQQHGNSNINIQRHLMVTTDRAASDGDMNSRGGTTTSVSATTTTTTTESDTAERTPNWRVLPLSSDNDDDSNNLLRATLNDRPRWSEQSYHAALAQYDDFVACTDSYMTDHIQQALNHLDHAYRLYGPDSVICSFNGGKDAVVILHLVRAAHARYYQQRLQQQQQQNVAGGGRKMTMVRPRVIYFDHVDEFPEIVTFLHESVETYDLDMISFERGVKFAQGLQVLVEHNLPSSSSSSSSSSMMPFPMAFVLGTRSSDPNAGQQGQFAPSSHYMPPFMRVNPVLSWEYGHVWHFLRLFHLPYCSLYDQGYTSLGTTKDTLPCPALAVAGGNTTSSNVPKYWPAYMLRDWDQERAGRIPKDKKKKDAKKLVAKSIDDLETTMSRADSSMGNLSIMSEMRTAAPVAAGDAGVDEDAQSSLIVSVDDSASAVSYSESSLTQKTVGVLIIGDEILKGLTADTNSFAAAKALREENVMLKRVAVVSDNQADIVKEINRLQHEVDVIITSGGVGPTHDDITIKSIAKALGCEMILHEEMLALLKEKMKNPDDDDATVELTEGQLKMATLPATSKLRYLSDNPTDWPVLQIRNIFVLPGIPEFFSKKIANVASYLSCQLERSKSYKIVLSCHEDSIVGVLNRVVENHPKVSIGSYPFVSHPEFKTVITVEGRLIMSGGLPKARSNSAVFDRSLIDASNMEMDEHVLACLDELISTLPNNSVLRVDNDNLALSGETN